MMYDAVLIGAGPSGLAAAARLSHFGVRVCLLEGHSRLGGLSSWHHVKGREISSGLHAFTNYVPGGRTGPLGKLFRQLRLRPDDLDLRPQDVSSIRFPSASLVFSNNTEGIRDEVAAKFPACIDGFDRLRGRIRETDEGELTLEQSSARAVLDEYIAEPLLRDMLLCPVMFYGNPGGLTNESAAGEDQLDMDWLLFCVVWKCIFESGFAYPACGMRPLWQELAKRVTDNGGVIRLGTRVERLVVKDGRVVAARLGSGEEIEGERFFSSAGGPETDALLGEASIGRELVPGEISIAEGIRVLSGSARDDGMNDTCVFYSLSDRFRFARPDGLVDTTSGVVCAPGNYEGVDEPILKVSQLANYPAWAELDPAAYGEAKKEAGAGMAAALQKLGVTVAASDRRFGGFDDLFTPVTLRRYTGHAEGALYGSPVKTRTGATAFDNLFLMGADQGFHGIVGAMLSGVAMANLHCLAKWKQS
ncbi:MAG: FAD-dependent oxidoreductase [Planctomycetaceae bacterium]|nr:FAD-dependent oxidoreductase [Planctomycetaceae bacterium]